MLYDWINEEAEDEEIKKFFKKGGLLALHKHLEKALNDVA
jgi:hypothetical protein